MGGAGIQNPNRQMGGNVSFAQSLSGSQPATPLDLSYVSPHFNPRISFSSSVLLGHSLHAYIYSCPRRRYALLWSEENQVGQEGDGDG
jgi:hypothetical protein